jgi:hypothetical protein
MFLQNWLNQQPKTIAFALTLLLFTLSYITIGWWTDSYQNIYDSILSGELTEYMLPAADPYPEYLTGAANFFTALGKLWPIHWVAFMLNVLLFVAFYVIYLQIIVHTKDLPLANRIVLLIFFTALFVESVVLYHMVRITMFLGVAGLSNILIGSEKQNSSWFPRNNWPYLILFVMALWVRSSVHLFVMAFVTVVMLVHGRSLKPLAIYYAIFSLFFINYINIVFIKDHSGDLNEQFLYNHEFKLHHTGAFTPDLKLLDGLDSLKYKAIKVDIVADEANLGVDFYERIGAFTNFSRTGFEQLEYAWWIFYRAMRDNMYFLYADIFLILSYLLLGGGSLKHYRTKTFALFVVFYIMVLGISFIKMENRFLVPFQVLFLMVIVFMHKPKLFYTPKFIWIAIVFLLAYLPVTAYYTNQKVLFAQKQHNNYTQSFEWLGQHYPNHTLVMNTVFVTMNRPYQTFTQGEPFANFFLYNYYAFSLSKTYRPFLESKCRCDVGDFYSFYDYLASQTSPVMLLDNPSRVPILEEYLDKVLHHPHHFERVELPMDVQQQLYAQSYRDSLSLYRMID